MEPSEAVNIQYQPMNHLAEKKKETIVQYRWGFGNSKKRGWSVKAEVLEDWSLMAVLDLDVLGG